MDLSKSSENRRASDKPVLPDVIPQNPDGSPVVQPADTSSDAPAPPPATRAHADAATPARREWRDIRGESRFIPYRRHSVLNKHTKASRSSANVARTPKFIQPEEAPRKWRPLPVRGGLWLTQAVPKLGYPVRKYLPIAPRGYFWLTGTAATALIPVAPRNRYVRLNREEPRGSDGDDVSSDEADDDERPQQIVVSQEVEVSSQDQPTESEINAEDSVDPSKESESQTSTKEANQKEEEPVILKDDAEPSVNIKQEQHNENVDICPPGEQNISDVNEDTNTFIAPVEPEVDPQEVTVRSEPMESDQPVNV